MNKFQIAKSHFEANKKISMFYVCSDEQCFLSEARAKLHAAESGVKYLGEVTRLENAKTKGKGSDLTEQTSAKETE